LNVETFILSQIAHLWSTFSPKVAGVPEIDEAEMDNQIVIYEFEKKLDRDLCNFEIYIRLKISKLSSTTQFFVEIFEK